MTLKLGKVTLTEAKALSPKFVQAAADYMCGADFDVWDQVDKLKVRKLALVQEFGGKGFTVVRISSIKLHQPPEGAPIVRVADEKASWRVSALALLD